MLVTTDGSIADIPRESYVLAEERVAKELLEAKKPFAIILNSKNPESESARELAESLEDKYSAPVALINCIELDEGDAKEIIRLVVGEFPIRELTFKLPEWTSAIGDHPIKGEILDKIRSFCKEIRKLSDLDGEFEGDFIKKELEASCGCCSFEVPIGKDKYFEVLSEITGLDIGGDKALFSTITELCEAKREYDKIKEALAEVRECGYGIVMPKDGELMLSEPTLIKQGGGYGVKVCAEAETIHLIKAGIKSEVCPALGTEEQAREVVKQMREEYATDPNNLLETKIFGRSLFDLVSDDMNAKLHHLPAESREKLGHTLEKIINEGARGLVCILV
jgi:stage IV sporulation protein A